MGDPKFNNTYCEVCGNEWSSEKTMPEDLLEELPEVYSNLEEASEAARFYGWNEENDLRFVKGYIALQAPGYDEVSEYVCKECNTHYCRWTGNAVG